MPQGCWGDFFFFFFFFWGGVVENMSHRAFGGDFIFFWGGGV